MPWVGMKKGFGVVLIGVTRRASVHHRRHTLGLDQDRVEAQLAEGAAAVQGARGRPAIALACAVVDAVPRGGQDAAVGSLGYRSLAAADAAVWGA